MISGNPDGQGGHLIVSRGKLLKKKISNSNRIHGRIKSGEGSLIGNSGEHYVVAELLKQGVVAALTPRNTPGFDILATKGKVSARIRVKTKSEQYDHFQWNIKKDGTIFREISRKNDFIVLVNLKLNFERPDFFVVPTVQVNRWLMSEFNKWLKTPGKNNRPHSVNNKQRHLSYKKFEKILVAKYRDDWDSILSR